MTTCTTAGQPCKNHAMPGTQFCKAHGGGALTIAHGAPLANSNALKHGFYRPVFSEEEYADLLTHAENLDLADELAVARIRLRRINSYIDAHEDTLKPDEYGRLRHPAQTAPEIQRRAARRRRATADHGRGREQSIVYSQ